MTKSDELCKLLGIVLKKDIQLTTNDLKYLKQTFLKYNFENHKICTNFNGYYSIYIPVCPDLTKPSNFVKLLECWHQLFGGGLPAKIDKEKSYTEQAINGLFTNMDEDYYGKDCEEIKDFKNQAQQTEWEY